MGEIGVENILFPHRIIMSGEDNDHYLESRNGEQHMVVLRAVQIQDSRQEGLLWGVTHELSLVGRISQVKREQEGETDPCSYVGMLFQEIGQLSGKCGVCRS